MNTPNRDEIIEAEAIEYLLRLYEPGSEIANPKEFAAFSEWLTRSPEHLDAFLGVSATWRLMDVATKPYRCNVDALIALALEERELDNVVALPRRAATPVSTHRSARRVSKWVVAATISLFAIGGIGYAYLIAANTYSNSGTEVQRVTLPDGSIVTLNPQSKIFLRWTLEERRLELKKGRARFQVTKNSHRPFLVQTTLSTVRAVGTIFDVEAHALETKVTVIEGKVAVESLKAASYLPRLVAARQVPAEAINVSLQLSAGDRASVSGDEVSGQKTSPSVMAWMSQRVVFRSTPLAAVVEELNRHHEQRVIIDDSSLATLVVSGVFDPKDPDLLLHYLDVYEGVRITHSGDGSILLSRRVQPAI